MTRDSRLVTCGTGILACASLCLAHKWECRRAALLRTVIPIPAKAGEVLVSIARSLCDESLEWCHPACPERSRRDRSNGAFRRCVAEGSRQRFHITRPTALLHSSPSSLLDTFFHLLNDLATRRSVAILSESAIANESKDLSSLTLLFI